MLQSLWFVISKSSIIVFFCTSIGISSVSLDDWSTYNCNRWISCNKWFKIIIILLLTELIQLVHLDSLCHHFEHTIIENIKYVHIVGYIKNLLYYEKIRLFVMSNPFVVCVFFYPNSRLICRLITYKLIPIRLLKTTATYFSKRSVILKLINYRTQIDCI